MKSNWQPIEGWTLAREVAQDVQEEYKCDECGELNDSHSFSCSEMLPDYPKPPSPTEEPVDEINGRCDQCGRPPSLTEEALNELEYKYKRRGERAKLLSDKVQELETQNKRYREALEKIYRLTNNLDRHPNIPSAWAVAKTALEGEK